MTSRVVTSEKSVNTDKSVIYLESSIRVNSFVRVISSNFKVYSSQKKILLRM